MGLDSSTVFFDNAKKKIGDLLPHVTLTQADLMDQACARSLPEQPAAIISTWALHDLSSPQAAADVYGRCYEILPKGGILVNGDFINPDGSEWTYEPGRSEIGQHLELLRRAGFKGPGSLALFGHNIDSPAAAHNCACLTAVK